MQKTTKIADKTMKKLFLIVLIIILTTKFGSAQLLDKYGFNIGTSYSNQIWVYTKYSNDEAHKDYKWGLSFFLSAEKELNTIFSIRPQFGYIQKGFKNMQDYTFNDTGTSGTKNKNVIYHDLAFDLSLKITPFKLKWNPYVQLGLRTDYMIAYKDVIGEEMGSGLKFNMFQSAIDKFNKFNLGGLIGIGLEIQDILYFEIEYNPTLTSSFNTPILDVKDITWDIKLGININKLLKKE
jgi:hypothetical protein